MKLKIAIAILFSMTILSCEKENLDYVWYRCAETGCADKWGVFANKSDTELKKAVKDYLKDNSVVFDKVLVGFDPALAESCMSCFCTTGRYIDIFAPPEENDMLNEYRFFKKNAD